VNFDDFRLHKERPRFKSPVTNPNTPATESLYPHAGLSAEEAAKEMVVPPGFKVQVAAAEPDVQQPIAMAIDDRGRIWIAEAYTYPTRAPEGKGKDRIIILEDTDLDGKLDKRTVFIEGLNLVSGLESASAASGQCARISSSSRTRTTTCQTAADEGRTNA
jgi:glucose/arabinose dehydrogenase